MSTVLLVLGVWLLLALLLGPIMGWWLRGR